MLGRKFYKLHTSSCKQLKTTEQVWYVGHSLIGPPSSGDKKPRPMHYLLLPESGRGPPSSIHISSFFTSFLVLLVRQVRPLGSRQQIHASCRTARSGPTYRAARRQVHFTKS